MKRIYRLLVILMGFIIFVAAYIIIEDDRFSNITNVEHSKF